MNKDEALVLLEQEVETKVAISFEVEALFVEALFVERVRKFTAITE